MSDPREHSAAHAILVVPDLLSPSFVAAPRQGLALPAATRLARHQNSPLFLRRIHHAEY
ncbi:MAG: hypothetical protein GJT30_13910 [Geobacter sp.]|nr:hypothetical protein [Geobacter sp.]